MCSVIFDTPCTLEQLRWELVDDVTYSTQVRFHSWVKFPGISQNSIFSEMECIGT